MSKIRVSLKKTSKGRASAIQLCLSAGFRTIDSITGEVKYSQLKVLLDKRIDHRFWDSSIARPTQEYSEKDKYKLYNLIESRVSLLSKAYNNLLESPFHDRVTPAQVKAEYDSLTGKEKTSLTSSRVSEFIKDYAKKSSAEKDLTKRHYLLLVDRILEFEEDQKLSLYWQTFDFKQYEGFVNWLKVKYKLADNTVWNYEKNLLKFRHLARQHSLIPLDKNWSRIARFQATDKLYLTWDIIRKIIDYEPNTRTLQNIKNLFQILLWTGLRYSDLDNFITFYKKSIPFGGADLALCKHPNPRVIVPALEPVRRIMDEFEPYVVSNAQFNSQVKVLVSRVIDSRTAINVSAHTCRRTFITLFLQWVPENILSRISGHKIGGNSAIFHSYNKITLEENAKLFMRYVQNIPKDETHGIQLVRFTEQIKMS